MTRVLMIDAAKCTGHARCYLYAAPGLLSGDDEGFVDQRGSRVVLRDQDIAPAELAEESCPEQAITIIDEDQP